MKYTLDFMHNCLGIITEELTLCDKKSAYWENDKEPLNQGCWFLMTVLEAWVFHI